MKNLWVIFAWVVVVCISTGTVKAAEDLEPRLFSVEVTGKGHPLILIPGLMSDARVWEPVQEELAENFQLHLISIKGFGKTPAPVHKATVQPGWLAALSEELTRYIKVNQLRKPHMVGHSMGGFLALSVAVNAPGQVGSIVSIDGVPYLAPLFTRDPATRVEDMQMNAKQMLAYYRSLTSVEQLAAAVAQGVGIQATGEEDQQWVIAMSTQSDPGVVAVAVHDLLQWDLREDLATIQQPVLLLAATGALPDALQEQAAQLYTQQLEHLPAQTDSTILKIHRGSRHFIMLDEPEWLIEHILGHLQ